MSVFSLTRQRRRRELCLLPLCVASGQGRAARGKRGRSGCHGQYRQCGAGRPAVQALPPGGARRSGRRRAGPDGVCGVRERCRRVRRGGTMQVITVRAVTQGDADAFWKSAGPAGWWMPDCTEVNGRMLNGETESVCQRQGRCGGWCAGRSRQRSAGWAGLLWRGPPAWRWTGSAAAPPRPAGARGRALPPGPASGTRPGWWSLCWCAP